MKIWKTIPFATALLVLQAQEPTVTIPNAAMSPATAPASGSVPLYQVTVVQGSAKAINYRNLKSSTKIELKGTVLAANASGMAKVKSKNGGIQIAAKFKDLPAASTFGSEFMTYVMWGISPEGRATNLGELIVKNGKSKVEVVESLQTFGLVVTAEPYFAVSQPSNVVIMENAVGKEAQNQVELIDAKYELLKRGQYTLNLASTEPMAMDKKTPFDVYQARNAVRIAQAAGASTYAEEALGKAQSYLQQADAPEGAKKGRIINAREAVQRAEDARAISVQRQAAEQVTLDKKIAQNKIDDANRAAAVAAAAQSAALQQNSASQTENEGLRSTLRTELNAILQTRATARGLIMNMSGMLFKTGKSDLAPGAREKLAKIAGILSAHKGLTIEADGFTDSKGTEAFNQRLSEARAQKTRDFLVSQGVAAEAITSKGFGEENPIATNDTDAGRKENRRVEIVVSGGGLAPQQ